uniref:Uncharacterized protein n=1 Tax=Strombidium rassoulzadegani TaxID=1082188 RepID=A0A7S3CRU7_9SPIT
MLVVHVLRGVLLSHLAPLLSLLGHILLLLMAHELLSSRLSLLSSLLLGEVVFIVEFVPSEARPYHGLGLIIEVFARIKSSPRARQLLLLRVIISIVSPPMRKRPFLLLVMEAGIVSLLLVTEAGVVSLLFVIVVMMVDSVSVEPPDLPQSPLQAISVPPRSSGVVEVAKVVI